jgi:hypothetical protein
VKPGMLCLSLVLACSCTVLEDHPYLAYDVRWTCVSPAGCERAEQVALIDRVVIRDTYDFFDFWSTQDRSFRLWVDVLDSDSLPPGCFLLTGFVLFENVLDDSLLCETEDGFEMELSVPNRDSSTHSQWRVELHYTGRLTQRPSVSLRIDANGD